MNRRGLWMILLLVFLAVNAYGGIAKINGFLHRYSGEMALTRAEMDIAWAHLTRAAAWLPDDQATHILKARLVHLAQTNGLRVDGLEGLTPEEVLRVGMDAAADAIRLCPSDPLGWFQVAEVYSGYQSARLRLERLVAVGRKVAQESDPEEGAPASEGEKIQPEDGIIVAATLRAQDLEPEFHSFRDFLARFYWERGLAAEAAAEARMSFALLPEPEAHPMLMDDALVRELGDAILEGVDMAASNPSIDPLLAQHARGDVLIELGRVDEAIAIFKDLRHHGDAALEAECSLALAKLYQGKRLYRESLNWLHRVLEIEPDGGRGISALYYLGLAHARLANHEDAVRYLRRYLAKRTGTLGVLMMLAGEHEALGDMTEAERYYAALVDRFPREPQPYVRLVGLLRSQRRISEAMAYAERLRNEIPEDPTGERLLREIQGDL